MQNNQSKIEKLISELCPNGVEFKNLGEVIERNPFKQLGAGELENLITGNGDVKLLPSSKDYDWFTDEATASDYICNGEVITMGRARYANIKYWNGKFVSANNHLITSYDPKKVLTRYIYHFILNHEKEFYIETSTYPKLDTTILNKFLIPVPPLAIQEEIVKILDSFTELEAELEAELEVRIKQYEHYRSELFVFNKNVEQESLDNIILSLKTGLNPRKNFVLNTQDAKNYYVTVREINGLDVTFFKKTDRVNNEALRLINNRSNLEVGDVLFSGTGTIGRTALIKEKPENWNIKEGIYVIKPNQKIVNSKFLLFFLNSIIAKKQIENKIVGSPVSSIPMTELKKIKIPVPPLIEQERIVLILDKFDALVSDISIGLPAELKARRQQYEYYRNKLLTFKEYVG